MDQSVVNLKNFQEITGGDQETELMLFDLFFEQSENDLKRLGNAVDIGAEEVWREAAHSLKGGATNLGATRMVELMDKAHSNELASREEKLALVEETMLEYIKVRKFIEAYQKQD